MFQKALTYWLMFLGVLFCMTINCNGKSAEYNIDVITTKNDTALYVFKEKPKRYLYKADKPVKVDCFYPDSIRFVNKKPNVQNTITIKYK